MFLRIRTKACKRCRGDLSLESDKYGTYIECIQCGAVWNESDLMHPHLKAVNERRVVETTKAMAVVNSGN